jgi:hypothetical protein
MADIETGATRDVLRPPAADVAPPPFRWGRAVVAAALIAALVGSTALGFRFVLSDPLPEMASTGPVIAADIGDGDAWPAAEVIGRLRLEGGCLLIDDAVAMFPSRTKWSEGEQAVLFDDGTSWQVGDEIRGGGGVLPAAGITDTGLGDAAASAAAACAADLGVDAVVLVRP